MKCPEARDLALTQDLAGDQVEALRAHARECSACAAELEGYLLASGLKDAPLERPSPSFADGVMARIETLPAPGRSSTERIAAAASFLITVAGLAFVFSVAKSLLVRFLADGVRVGVPVGPLKEAVLKLVHVADICLTVVIELVKLGNANATATLCVAIAVACALAATLFAARSRELA